MIERQVERGRRLVGGVGGDGVYFLSFLSYTQAKKSWRLRFT